MKYKEGYMNLKNKSVKIANTGQEIRQHNKIGRKPC